MARILASQAYVAYANAQTTAEATRLHGQTMSRDLLFAASFTGSVISGLTSLFFLGGRPSPDAIREELRTTEAELATLQGGAE